MTKYLYKQTIIRDPVLRAFSKIGTLIAIILALPYLIIKIICIFITVIKERNRHELQEPRKLGNTVQGGTVRTYIQKKKERIRTPGYKIGN